MKESEDKVLELSVLLEMARVLSAILTRIVFRTGDSDTSRFMENFGIFF